MRFAVGAILVVVTALAVMAALAGAYVAFAIRARDAWGGAGLVGFTVAAYLTLLAAVWAALTLTELRGFAPGLIRFFMMVLIPVLTIVSAIVEARSRRTDEKARRGFLRGAVVAFGACLLVTVLLVLVGLAGMNPDGHH